MHQYDINTIWCTMHRLRKRIKVFAAKTLTYNADTTAPHNKQDDSSDSEEEIEDTSSTPENETECPESKFNFQINHTDAEQPKGTLKCSFNSITGCLENIKSSIKLNVVKWKAGKSQSFRTNPMAQGKTLTKPCTTTSR